MTETGIDQSFKRLSVRSLERCVGCSAPSSLRSPREMSRVRCPGQPFEGPARVFLGIEALDATPLASRLDVLGDERHRPHRFVISVDV
jgi:hypothetical protein